MQHEIQTILRRLGIEDISYGACIGGAGSFGGTSRHPLVFNECTKSCWPSAAGNYNSSLVEQFLKQENDTFTSKATTK